ncbi:MAG: hypothetical protein KIT14_05195 [bacterium]|nr:hypothetical protein [bacterium]
MRRPAPITLSTRRTLLACAGALALWLGTAAATRAATCPTSVDAAAFASAAQLRAWVEAVNAYGPRILGSPAHDKAIRWLAREAKSIRGATTSYDRYRIWRWLPRTRMQKGPGLDIARAGGLTITPAGGATVRVPVAGAVHWSSPTRKQGRRGPLVRLDADAPITAANARGKIVLVDFPKSAIPYVLFQFVGLYITPDILNDPGSYDRPYLGGGVLHDTLLAAGAAGAAGVVFAFDVPREQVAGYYDPHTGTIYGVPAVFVGSAEAEQLRAAAAQGGAAAITVRAKVGRGSTKNLVATVPGTSPEKISLMANTDGNSWVQENGIVGMLALARYYGSLPMECRPRTLELAFTSAHDAIVQDGGERYVRTLNAEYEQGLVAFGFAIEHLGTREILAVGEGADRHLAFSGLGDVLLFAAGDSDVLKEVAVSAAQRRNLDRTAVLRGVDVPDESRVPPLCSLGGLGNFYHRNLIPTLAMISGPWSLYDPVFGAEAIDFERMRSQLLAAGDAILALAALPRDEIAGDYLAFRTRVAQGAPTCAPEIYPQFGPRPSK